MRGDWSARLPAPAQTPACLRELEMHTPTFHMHEPQCSVSIYLVLGPGSRVVAADRSARDCAGSPQRRLSSAHGLCTTAGRCGDGW